MDWKETEEGGKVCWDENWWGVHWRVREGGSRGEEEMEGGGGGGG